MNCYITPLIGEDEGSFRLKRKEHLKGRKEIREVFDKGKRFGIRDAKLFTLMNNLPYNRICFSFSRGFGNAVVRNRARRLSREAFRLLKPRLNGGHDLILIINKEECCKQIQCSSVPAGTAEIIRKMTLSGRVWQLKTLFTKAGLFK